jgi:regulator of protease activity HflC (stomatin/prohibitin superfamily)
LVEPDEAGIRVTFGNRVKDLGSGWYWYCPLFQNIRKVNIVSQVIDLPEQMLTSRDGKTIFISGGIVYSIKHPRKTILNVQDYDQAIQVIGMRYITQYVMEREFEGCKDIDQVCKGIFEAVRRHGFKWGIEVEEAFLTDMAEGKVVRIALKGSGTGLQPFPYEGV